MPSGNPHLLNLSNHMMTCVIILHSPNWPIRACHVTIFQNETLTLVFLLSHHHHAESRDNHFHEFLRPPRTRTTTETIFASFCSNHGATMAPTIVLHHFLHTAAARSNTTNQRCGRRRRNNSVYAPTTAFTHQL